MITTAKRLKMAIGEEISINDEELQVYLIESGLTPDQEYTINLQIGIKKATLAVLESIANNPSSMKNYKFDEDLTISNFSVNLQNRIKQIKQDVVDMQRIEDQKNTLKVLYLICFLIEVS